jgi:hypothetical protein
MLSDITKAAAITAGMVLYVAAAVLVVIALSAVVHPAAAIAFGFFLIMTPCIWAVS